MFRSVGSLARLVHRAGANVASHGCAARPVAAVSGMDAPSGAGAGCGSLAAPRAPLGVGASWGVHASGGAVRGVMTKMQRKRIRKKRAREIRALIKYAERYDPMRKCVRGVYQTLGRLGWEFSQNHFITEGCHTMFALVDQLIAIEVVSPEEYETPPAANVAPITLSRVLSKEEVEAASQTSFIPHTSTGIVHESLVNPPKLNAETQAKHDIITAKGWDLLVIHQPDWAVCCEHPKQHLARIDYVVQRALRLRAGLEPPADVDEELSSDDEDYDSE